MKQENLKDGSTGLYNHNLMEDVFGNIHFNFHKTFKQFKAAIVFQGIEMEKLQLFLNSEINLIILFIILIKQKLMNLPNLKKL